MLRKLVSLLAMPLAFSTISAFAADPFADGCASYTAGNYEAAKTQFMAAVKAKPKSWQAQYQLGNACMQLKETENAKTAYQKCLTLRPDTEIKKNCQSAIAFLSAPPKPPPVVVEPKKPEVQIFRGDSLNGAGNSASGSGSGDDWRQKAIQARKDRILSDAREEAERIRAEGKQAVEDGNASSNRRFLNRETGERSHGLRQDESEEITRGYERRANEVLKEARRKASEIISP